MKNRSGEYAQDDAMDVYPVRMTAKHARQARAIGGGNFSEGVRASVEGEFKRVAAAREAKQFPKR